MWDTQGLILPRSGQALGAPTLPPSPSLPIPALSGQLSVAVACGMLVHG